MPSYVVTGTSRGIGYEILRQLSSDSKNIVIGLVRDKAGTRGKPLGELKARPNVHILQADLTDYGGLQEAAKRTAQITDGTLDYLIANAAIVSSWSAYDSIGVLGLQPKELEQDLLESYRTNVIGDIHLFNLFMPIILKGRAKKVIAISTGMADVDTINNWEIDVAAPYSISKAGMNAAVAKFSAQYAKDGVLFMSICPGSVHTGHHNNATEEQMKGLSALMRKFVGYAPHFTGPTIPEATVKDVLSVVDKASVENGDAGSFVSHFGNKQWL